MRRQAICWIILAALFLTGCSKQELKLYTVVEANNNGYIVIEDGNAFSYENEEYTPLSIQYASYKPIKPLNQFAPEYNLVHTDLSSYTGGLTDAAGYINYLQSLDYVTKSTLYNSSTLDVLLASERDEIRVLYLGGDTVRIFYRNFVDGSSLPPYIYKEG